MSVDSLNFVEPFFSVKYVRSEKECAIGKRSIVFNLSRKPIRVNHQLLEFYSSAVFTNITISDVDRCLVIEDFERNRDHEALFEAIKKKWTLVYEATKVERHRGVELWRSEKVKLDDTEVNMCYAASIPLNVGLHRTHWGDRPFREVHTQILGYGEMQQYREQDLEHSLPRGSNGAGLHSRADV